MVTLLLWYFLFNTYFLVDELRQQFFESVSMTALCSKLHEDKADICVEALNVLSLAAKHGKLFLTH